MDREYIRPSPRSVLEGSMAEDKQIPAVPLASRRLAKEVVDRSEFLDIRVHQLSAEHDLNPLTPAEFDVAVAIEAKPDVRVNSRLEILMRFNVTATASQGGSGALRLGIAYVLEYSLSSADGLSPDHFAAFAEWVGVYNAWPYLREFVQDTTAKMETGTIRLPLFRPAGTGHSAGKVDTSWNATN